MKVAQFANSILSDKNVLRPDHPVHYILIVHRHDSHDQMGERAQDLVFGEVFFSFMDQMAEAALRTILHHDKHAVTVAEIFVELFNCWAFDYLIEVVLATGGLFFSLTHVVKVDFF